MRVSGKELHIGHDATREFGAWHIAETALEHPRNRARSLVEAEPRWQGADEGEGDRVTRV